MSKRIEIQRVTRVEGHGNILVEIDDGRVKDCRFEITETPRFFEAMLRGRPYREASHITSRICGICATGHATTSLRATEKALGVELSEQTSSLRKLSFFGEILDSHILHLYMLVAPDFFGVGSVIPLLHSHPQIVQRALRMKKLAGDICALVSGRHTHPIAMTVGGFTHIPIQADLLDLRERLERLQPDIEATIDLFSKIPFPKFERETEYVSLTKPNEYAFIDGEILTSDGMRLPVEEYRSITNEHLVPHSSAKHTYHRQTSYMVGALARFNNNYTQLHPLARQAATTLGLKPKVTNPYLISAAQAIEIVHTYQESITVVDQLLEKGIEPEEPAPVNMKSGEGVGACEVPRGMLIHHYWIGEDGLISGADCVIPTNQNLANIEMDMKALVPEIKSQPLTEIRTGLEMLVRAYDPCISCSVHLLEVRH